MYSWQSVLKTRNPSPAGLHVTSAGGGFLTLMAAGTVKSAELSTFSSVNKKLNTNLLPNNSVSRSQIASAYGSIQSEQFDNVDAFAPKYIQPYGTCAKLNTALRFKDGILEKQFVKEQYRTSCFMRTVAVFGVIQILIAPSIFYEPNFFWQKPDFLSSRLFQISVGYVSLCVAGGLLLVLCSKFRRMHHLWTAIGISSTMLIFCGYYLFCFVYFYLPGHYTVYTEQGKTRIPCNESSWIGSSHILSRHIYDAWSTHREVNQSAFVRYDFTCINWEGVLAIIENK